MRLRPFRPIVVAFCVTAGIVCAEFAVEPRPVGYLVRPLIATTVLSIVIGLAASFIGRAAVVAAGFLTAWVVHPGSPIAIAVAVIAMALIMYRLVRSQILDVEKPLAIGAAVFLVAGAMPVIPLISWSTPARAAIEGTPTYLILVDGYPRADTLADLGEDISPFLDDLEERGFDLYADATSHHGWTYRTLTYMTTGRPMANDNWGEPLERRQARESWDLPDGFIAIAPPAGAVTIPNTVTLNPGGPTLFDAVLLHDSVVGGLFDDYIMDGFRFQLNRALDLLASTDENRVFAHLMAPHTPFLYDGEDEAPAPECWPECGVIDISVNRLGMTVDEWADGTAGFLAWLNPRLIGVVDSILARHPDAEIVLFSDHGGRFSESEPEEWHDVFLAARTPVRPDLFEHSPHPESIFRLLGS